MSDFDNNARMERLSRRDGNTGGGEGYTRFIRSMRLVLPLVAVGVTAVLFLRSGDEDQLVISPQESEFVEDVKARDVARNELLNPKFESTDKKSQPYEITADRAVQGEKNKDLVMLDRPVGRMTMSDGDVVHVHSETGAYRQDTERFFLEGQVSIEHVQGYVLTSSEAHIDLKQNLAWSEKDVQAIGPDMKIDAQGVRANGKTGELVFQGPVKLVFDKGFEGVAQ